MKNSKWLNCPNNWNPPCHNWTDRRGSRWRPQCHKRQHAPSQKHNWEPVVDSQAKKQKLKFHFATITFCFFIFATSTWSTDCPLKKSSKQLTHSRSWKMKICKISYFQGILIFNLDSVEVPSLRLLPSAKSFLCRSSSWFIYIYFRSYSKSRFFWDYVK